MSLLNYKTNSHAARAPTPSPMPGFDQTAQYLRGRTEMQSQNNVKDPSTITISTHCLAQLTALDQTASAFDLHVTPERLSLSSTDTTVFD